MAVDWSSYRLAPDFSGLAAGIQGYFQNRQAAEIAAANQAMEQQKMGMEEAYRNQMLDLERDKMNRTGISPTFALDVRYGNVLYTDGKGGYYKPKYVTDRATGQTQFSYFNEVTGDEIAPDMAQNLGLKPTTIDIETASGKAGAARRIAEETEKGKGAGKAASTEGVTTAQADADYYITIREQGLDAAGQKKQAERMLKLALDPKTSMGAGAEFFTSAKKVLGFNVANDEEFAAGAGKLVDGVLRNYSGPQTDGDALRAAAMQAQQSKSREGNIRLLQELVRFNETKMQRAKLANQIKNEKGRFSKDVFIDRILSEQESQQQGQGAPAQQPVQKSEVIKWDEF